jgi:chromosome segregation ATPase
MNPHPSPPYVALTPSQRLTDLEDENRRLWLAKKALEERYDHVWKQTTDYHAIAERTATENAELRAGKRKLEEAALTTEARLRGALSENSRLQMVAQAADAKRAKAEADVLHANAECRRQTNAIKAMEADAATVRADVERVKLEKQFLSSSLQNANAKVRGLTAEVLEHKNKQMQCAKAGKEEADLRAKVAHLQRKADELAAKGEDTAKVDALRAKNDALKARNEELEKESAKLRRRLAKLDALHKDKAARLAEIAALAQKGGVGQSG